MILYSVLEKLSLLEFVLRDVEERPQVLQVVFRARFIVKALRRDSVSFPASKVVKILARNKFYIDEAEVRIVARAPYLHLVPNFVPVDAEKRSFRIRENFVQGSLGVLSWGRKLLKIPVCALVEIKDLLKNLTVVSTGEPHKKLDVARVILQLPVCVALDCECES